MNTKSQGSTKPPQKTRKVARQQAEPVATNQPEQPAKQDNFSPAPAPSLPMRNHRTVRNYVWAALALSLGACVVGGLAWYRVAVPTDRELAEQRNRIDIIAQRFDALSEVRGDTEKQIEQLQKQLDKAEGNVDGRLQNLHRQMLDQQTTSQSNQEEVRREMKAFSQSIAKLRFSVGRSLDKWSLSEVEQLMLIANQRLQLSADIDLAKKALQLAEASLQQLSDPTFAPVRAILATEIASLNAVQQPQITITLNEITEMAHALDDLPLVCQTKFCGDEDTDETPQANQTQPDSLPDSSFWGTVQSMLADLAELVHIDTADTADQLPTAMLSAEWQWISLEKIKLVLESSKLALLRGQSEAYTARLEEAKKLVNAHFTYESVQVDAWLQRLDELVSRAEQTELPDISASLRALRETIQAGN